MVHERQGAAVGNLAGAPEEEWGGVGFEPGRETTGRAKLPGCGAS